jgi:3-oxoacyl-[acyl-carrier-protein] synthase-3
VAGEVVPALLARNGASVSDLEVALLHQASAVMLDAVERRIGAGEPGGPRVPRTLERYGNTSGAGVAIALAEERALAPGRHALLATFGGGYALGAALLRVTEGAAPGRFSRS